MLRCLFGPASASLVRDRLGLEARHRLFDVDGAQSFRVSPDAGWEELARQFPADWQPDCLVLWLAYTGIPPKLWKAPLPIIGVAADWNLNWSAYRRLLPRCDVVLTDLPGVETLRRAGIRYVLPANLYGLGPSFLAETVTRGILTTAIWSYRPCSRKITLQISAMSFASRSTE